MSTEAKKDLVAFLSKWTIDNPSILEKIDDKISTASCLSAGANFYALEKIVSCRSFSTNSGEQKGLRCIGMALFAVLPVIISQGKKNCKIIIDFSYLIPPFDPIVSDSATGFGLIEKDLSEPRFRTTMPEDFASLQPRVRMFEYLTPDELKLIGF